jgi:hypothetical protein
VIPLPTPDFLWNTGALLLRVVGDRLAPSAQLVQNPTRPSDTSTPPAPQVDLSPLLVALEEVRGDSEEILDVLRNPTKTAAEEFRNRAAHAYARGWYDNSFDDAQKSVEAFPYSPSAQLLLALSAFALSRPEPLVSALSDCIKFSEKDEPAIGATAALIAANVADASNASTAGDYLLRTMNSSLEGRCLPVVAAIHIRDQDDDMIFEQLLELFCDVGVDPSKEPLEPCWQWSDRLHRYTKEYRATAQRIDSVDHEIKLLAKELERSKKASAQVPGLLEDMSRQLARSDVNGASLDENVGKVRTAMSSTEEVLGRWQSLWPQSISAHDDWKPFQRTPSGRPLIDPLMTVPISLTSDQVITIDPSLTATKTLHAGPTSSSLEKEPEPKWVGRRGPAASSGAVGPQRTSPAPKRAASTSPKSTSSKSTSPKQKASAPPKSPPLAPGEPPPLKVSLTSTRHVGLFNRTFVLDIEGKSYTVDEKTKWTTGLVVVKGPQVNQQMEFKVLGKSGNMTPEQREKRGDRISNDLVVQIDGRILKITYKTGTPSGQRELWVEGQQLWSGKL